MQCREAFLAYRETSRAGTKAAVNGFIELHRRVAAASGSVPSNGYARHSDFALRFAWPMNSLSGEIGRAHV